MSHKYNKDDDYKRDIRLDDAPPPDETPNPHATHHRRPSRFWLFAFSFLPGLSHIYMGLVRRGLFYVSALAFVIFFTSAIVPSFGIFRIITIFSIFALYAVSFFEAFSIRRDMIMGKEVKDVIPNLAIFGGSKVIIIVIAVVFAVSLGINILSSLPWYAWVILGIVAICYAPYIRGRKRSKPSDGGNDEN